MVHLPQTYYNNHMKILTQDIINKIEPMITEQAMDDLESMLKDSLKSDGLFMSNTTVKSMLSGIRQLIMLGGGSHFSHAQVVFIITLQKLSDRYEAKLKDIKI